MATTTEPLKTEGEISGEESRHGPAPAKLVFELRSALSNRTRFPILAILLCTLSDFYPSLQEGWRQTATSPSKEEQVVGHTSFDCFACSSFLLCHSSERA